MEVTHTGEGEEGEKYIRRVRMTYTYGGEGGELSPGSKSVLYAVIQQLPWPAVQGGFNV